MLVLVSAGQTIAERDKIFIGQGDSPFTDDGLSQIADVAETLAPYQFDIMYTSDLYRAQETLRAIRASNRYETPWEIAEELRERSGGSYEGKPYSEIRVGMSPKQYKAWERDPFEPPLHGESLSDVEDRVREWFIDIDQSLSQNKSILMVSHPDTMRVIIAMARGDDLLDACSLSIEHGMPYFYHGRPQQ